MNEVNPYESPRLDLAEADHPALPILPEAHWHEVDVRVASVDRRWWTRRISLAGSIDAEIFYDPAGHGESVYVNGKLAATTSFWHWAGNVYPHVDFSLEMGQHAVPASIDVAVSMLRLMRITKFELVVAGRTVYKEPA